MTKDIFSGIVVEEFLSCDEVHRMLSDAQYDKHAVMEAYRLHHMHEMELAARRADYEYDKGFEHGASGCVAGMMVIGVGAAITSAIVTALVCNFLPF